jgi:hypothetical protein
MGEVPEVLRVLVPNRRNRILENETRTTTSHLCDIRLITGCFYCMVEKLCMWKYFRGGVLWWKQKLLGTDKFVMNGLCWTQNRWHSYVMFVFEDGWDLRNSLFVLNEVAFLGCLAKSWMLQRSPALHCMVKENQVGWNRCGKAVKTRTYGTTKYFMKQGPIGRECIVEVCFSTLPSSVWCVSQFRINLVSSVFLII